MPHAGTWIEITQAPAGLEGALVVPHAGTWIEIRTLRVSRGGPRSCLTQARGLKSPLRQCGGRPRPVVPHAGTWIEIHPQCLLPDTVCVVPHAGTWIEITGVLGTEPTPSSCLTQARGLK